MAIYRPVHVTFWQDPKVIEEMTPEDKLFYLYLITNPKTTQIGIYQITKKQISFELGYSIESINVLMDRFINYHKNIKYNKETRELAILNWGKYNFPRAGTPMENCVKKELKGVKDKELIKLVGEKIKNKKIKAIFDNFLNNPCDELRDGECDEGNNNNNNYNKEEINVVVDEIKKAFNSFDDKTIKAIEDSFKKKGKDINYLLEKIDMTKKANTNNAAGYLISAITNDYKFSINNAKCFIPQVKTRFHNINQTFMNYDPDELEKLLRESQKGKFQ